MAKRKRSKPEIKLRKHPSGATAAQMVTRDATVVALGKLRVLITKEDGAWIAQGLEIDYAIDGKSLKDAKVRWETGLGMTIESHLRVYGTIDNLLKAAPPEVWADYYADWNALRRYDYDHVTVYALQNHLPFDGIEFYEKVNPKVA